MPKDAKPFHGVGSGVFEIALAYETNAYRTVFAVQLGAKIYVLHAFQKKAKSGIKTPQKDIDLIKRRYKEAKKLAKHEEQSEKKIEFEESSGNVFVDLGLTDADELFARAQIGFGVYKILKGKDL